MKEMIYLSRKMINTLIFKTIQMVAVGSLLAYAVNYFHPIRQSIFLLGILFGFVGSGILYIGALLLYNYRFNNDEERDRG